MIKAAFKTVLARLGAAVDERSILWRFGSTCATACLFAGLVLIGGSFITVNVLLGLIGTIIVSLSVAWLIVLAFWTTADPRPDPPFVPDPNPPSTNEDTTT